MAHENDEVFGKALLAAVVGSIFIVVVSIFALQGGFSGMRMDGKGPALSFHAPTVPVRTITR